MKNEPTLLISGAAAAALARPGDYLAAVRTAFTDLARDRYEIAPVAHLSGQGGALHIKSASRTGTAPLIVVKANANFPSNVVYGLPTIQGFIALIDAGNGRLLALMDSGEITARRTAAATALAAEHLARRDSRVLASVRALPRIPWAAARIAWRVSGGSVLLLESAQRFRHGKWVPHAPDFLTFS